jgi:hypothetical protein
MAQPGQSGHTVWVFAISTVIRVGTRYDAAIVRHATSKIEREEKREFWSRLRILMVVMRALGTATKDFPT